MISCFIDLREDFYQYHIYMFAVLATLHEVSKELGMWFTILINDGSGSCFFSLLQPLLSKAHREVPHEGGHVLRIPQEACLAWFVCSV